MSFYHRRATGCFACSCLEAEARECRSLGVAPRRPDHPELPSKCNVLSTVRRKSLPLSVCSLILTAAAGSWISAADGRTPGKCIAEGSKTVAFSAHARVFRLRGGTYGCLLSTGRRVMLGQYVPKDDYGESGQRNVVLAGRYVAFESFSVGRGRSLYRVSVVDLRTGTVLHDAATVPVSPANDSQQEAVGLGPTTRIRLRSTGQVAWIARDPYGASPVYVIRKIDDRRSIDLDNGEDIGATSLRLSGSTLRWTHAGQPRTAQLGRPIG